MGIAPSQSDARYPYGHTFSLKVTAPGICQSNLDFHIRSYAKCQIGTLPRVYQVPILGTRPFSYHNHRHLLLHKYHGISFEKCAWFSKFFWGFTLYLSPDRRKRKCSCRYNFYNGLTEPILLIVVPLSRPICRLQGLFTAPVFPRRYCSVDAHNAALLPGRGIFVPVCWFTFQGAISFFDKTKKPTHMEVVSAPLPWGSLPPIGSVHFIPYISTLGPKSGFMAIPTRCQNRRLSGWSQAPKVEPRRPVRWWKRTIFLFIQFSRSFYTNRITRQKVRVNRKKSAFTELLKPKVLNFTISY